MSINSVHYHTSFNYPEINRTLPHKPQFIRIDHSKALPYIEDFDESEEDQFKSKQIIVPAKKAQIEWGKIHFGD